MKAGEAVEQWVVRLRGDQDVLKELARSCTTPALSVTAKDGEFFLESTDFSAADTYDHIVEQARTIIAYINGACSLTMSGHTPIQNDIVFRCHADGTRRVFKSETITKGASFWVAIPRADGTVRSGWSGRPNPQVGVSCSFRFKSS
jgi:hypothetical protein